MPSRGLRVVREFVDVETAKKPGRAGFDEMVKFLKRSSVRVLWLKRRIVSIPTLDNLRNLFLKPTAEMLSFFQQSRAAF
jgi:hypothetical protein